MTVLIAALGTAALGGCATSSFVGDPFNAPAKFQYLRCEDIAKRLAEAQARDQELRVLMDRANTGVGGSAVSMFVYAPDQQNVQSDLRLLRQAAGEKRCSDEVLKTLPKSDISPLH